MKHSVYISFSILFLLFIVGSLSAQTPEEAKALFTAGKYAEAKTAYDALLKKTPANASYNYYYGAACYETGNLTDAEKYLKTAASKRVPESFMTLGDLYFSSYRFNDAVSNYQKYLPFIKKDAALTAKYNDKIKKAEYGENMLQRVEKVIVIDSIIVDKDAFLKAYKLSKESGTLFSYNDFFGNSDAPAATVFRTERGDRILYADKGNNGKFDLYTQDKLAEGYGNKKKLSDIVNSNHNENYPFMLNDGVTIYYASDNEETSLGGYDIYITRYNLANDSYLAPENIGMPFNSPYNDYMMAIDEFYGVGWFASDRFQPAGKVIIYVFIPNEEKIILRSEDENYLRSMAKLNNIQATKSNNETYADLLNKIYNQKQIEKKAGDFEFIVADDLIYINLDDFKSPAAKNYFIQGRETEKKVNDLQEKLNAQRLEYGMAPASQKQKLSNSIAILEKETEALENEPEALYLKARNEEVRFIIKK